MAKRRNRKRTSTAHASVSIPVGGTAHPRADATRPRAADELERALLKKRRATTDRGLAVGAVGALIGTGVIVAASTLASPVLGAIGLVVMGLGAAAQLESQRRVRTINRQMADKNRTNSSVRLQAPRG